MSDPVSLIGAGALGALGSWVFQRLIRVARPMNGGGVLSEVKQINRRLSNIEGTLRGLEGRVGALENGGI